MNRRLIGVFSFALVVAAATSALVYKLIVAHVQTAAPKQQVMPSNHVLVAAHDLGIGSLVTDADVSEVAWPGPVPPQAVRARQDIVGRGVIATIYKSEPITEPRLAPKGAGAGLASTIPIGKRAVALRVNEVIGLAGFVLPGMRVDVLIAGAAPGDTNNNTRCRTVLQNIEVLSAGQKLDKSPDGKPEMAEVVNLLVTPDQAEVLNLASTEAKVQLVLRNPLDTEEAQTHGTTVASIFGVRQEAPIIVQRAASPAPTVEVFTGSKRAEQAVMPAPEVHP